MPGEDPDSLWQFRPFAGALSAAFSAPGDETTPKCPLHQKPPAERWPGLSSMPPLPMSNLRRIGLLPAFFPGVFCIMDHKFRDTGKPSKHCGLRVLGGGDLAGIGFLGEAKELSCFVPLGMTTTGRMKLFNALMMAISGISLFMLFISAASTNAGGRGSSIHSAEKNEPPTQTANKCGEMPWAN